MARARRRLWPFAVGLGALGVLVALLGLGGWVLFRVTVAKAAARLYGDAMALGAEPLTRPGHAQPVVAGSFGACAAGRLSGLVDLLKDEPEACKAFRAPKTPPAKIPDACLALVTPRNALAGARGLFACARTERAGGGPGEPPAAPWQQAAAILAWEIRGQAASGQCAAALETCLDVFAAARDLSPHAGVVGAQVGSALVRTVAPACSDAVLGADPPTRATFHASLETIRRGWWSNAKTLRDERVATGLASFGFELAPSAVAELPTELRARIGTPPRSFTEAIATDRLMLSSFGTWLAVEPIADLPEAERAPRLAALAKDRTGGVTVEHLGRFLRTLDATAALLQLLSAASDVAPVSTAAVTVTPAGPGFALTPVDPSLLDYALVTR